MGYMDEYKFWLESDCFDEKTKEELRSIADDDKEIQDRFYKNLKFGTGGMRGIMGAGTNRMNIYTVTKATQGLAEHMLQDILILRGYDLAAVLPVHLIAVVLRWIVACCYHDSGYTSKLSHCK